MLTPLCSSLAHCDESGISGNFCTYSGQKQKILLTSNVDSMIAPVQRHNTLIVSSIK